jgi:uncharacterized metal-binding protein
MGYKAGHGLWSLIHEASILFEILEKHGFEVVAASCKVGESQRGSV